MPDDPRARPASRHLLAIGHQPRAAGSVAEAEARQWCRTVLEGHGFSVTEEPFAYSAAIGRWMVPLCATLVALALGATSVAWRSARPGASSAIALGVLGLVIGLAARRAATTGVLTFPLARREGVNLVATRGTPSVWLVAHLDTKSQPMPTLVRAGLLVVLGVALVATVAVSIWWPASRPAPWALPLVGTLAGFVLSFATVGNESPGARDNATGVAAVLAAAGQLAPGQSLGVMIPSAEELGLAGMRAWVRGRSPGTAINVDTVDDVGPWRCMVHGAASRPLAQSVAAAMRATGMGELRVSGVIPGLLTDGVALADAGWRAVTLSRGNWQTLARIHRPGDSVLGLVGTGADELSPLLAALVNTRI